MIMLKEKGQRELKETSYRIEHHKYGLKKAERDLKTIQQMYEIRTRTQYKKDSMSS